MSLDMGAWHQQVNEPMVTGTPAAPQAPGRRGKKLATTAQQAHQRGAMSALHQTPPTSQ